MGRGGWELEVSLEWEWGTNVLRARGVFMGEEVEVEIYGSLQRGRGEGG